MLKIDCELPVSEGQTPLWRELFWAAEWFALRSSDVYQGMGVPRGRGEPVILVPGFLASDLSLDELHHWLERIGYRVHNSGIGRNDDCPDVLLAELLEAVESVAVRQANECASSATASAVARLGGRRPAPRLVSQSSPYSPIGDLPAFIRWF